jgi:hypothetical protein
MLAKVIVTAFLVYSAFAAAIAAEVENSSAYGEGLQKDNIITGSALGVNVDILPGICPNSLNITGQGLLPIAVLGTNDFDVNIINPSTISLTRAGSAGKISAFRWHYGDIAAPFAHNIDVPCQCQLTGPDGYTDLILEFDTYMMAKFLDLPIAGETNIAINLTGNLQGSASSLGSQFEGSDCISVSGGI